MATANEVKPDYSVSGAVGQNTPICSNCIETGASKTATCFCSECDLALCGTCETLHRKIASSHEIERYNNEGSEADQEQSRSIVRCSVHRGQEATLFCEDHDLIICPACKEDDHSGCSVQTISEACEKTDVSLEMCEALDKLTTLEGKIDNLRRAKQLKMNVFTTKFEERKDEIKTLRKKFSNVFDRYEGELESKQASCKANISSSLRKYDILSTKVNEAKHFLENSHNKETMFKQMIASKGVVKKVKEELAAHSETTITFETSITEDGPRHLPSLLVQMSKLTHQGVADPDEIQEDGNGDEQKRSFLKLKSCTNIKTVEPKVRGDKGEILITGCCWLPDDNGVVICDYETKNKTLKLLDKDLNVTFTAVCSSNPYDVALINESCAVVTLPETKEIQFIGIKPGFRFKEKKNINFIGYGVGVNGQYIFVCGFSLSSTRGVKLLTLTGEDAGFIRYQGTGNPYKLCLDTGGKIYHTGGSGDSMHVTSVTLDGHGLFSVSSEDLHEPLGIVCDKNGNVLVCDVNKKCVQVISSTGVCGNSVLTDKEYEPKAMCINKSCDRLIIAWRRASDPYNTKLTLYNLNYN